MVDIPTGYFFLTVSGSGILAIGTVVLLARLFGFRFTTQQVGAINKPADSPEHISLFQRELLKLGDEKMHYIPQAELKVPYGLGDRASALVHSFMVMYSLKGKLKMVNIHCLMCQFHQHSGTNLKEN